jgi:hypothetical protein
VPTNNKPASASASSMVRQHIAPAEVSVRSLIRVIVSSRA